MKKELLNIWWMVILALAFVACSDNNDEPEPPEPPGPEYKEGINLFPEEPAANKELEIVFKASSTSELYNYTGEVYVHIGVVEGTVWGYVPADWDENISKCKMTKVEENIWSITLSPDIRTWFGAPATAFVQKIGILFRSADGTKKGIKEDSFITVEDNNFNPGEIEYAKQPAGTVEGINIIDATTVTLVLYDKDQNNKYREYAYVTGDFNDWKISNTHKMKRDDDTGCWWLTLSGLEGGREYAFQYYLGTQADGAIRVADPYTEKILDPANDQYIPASTYPDLRAYPSDKTSGIVSTFNTQPVRGNSSFIREIDKNNLVIYEMLFRDFTESGDINGALERLDYLKQLGVNAIEIMPVQEFDGNESWGYNPCFYFAMDKAYGTKEMYHRFIDECHARGMAVILDVVYNHSTGNSPFAQLYWDAQNNKTSSVNPWFNVDAPHPHSVFHDFNHDSPLVRKLVKRNLKFLLEEYKFDGFRFDLTKGFTQKQTVEPATSAYDDTRIAILKDYNEAIKEVHPEAIVILEHFAVEQEEKALAEAGMQLWRNRNWAYCQSAMGYSSESSFEGLTTINTTMPFGGWVGYMESHDEERAGYKQTAYGDGDLKTNLEKRMKQLQVNAAFFFTVPGPKMLWQFGERGYDIARGDDEIKLQPKPPHWEYIENPQRKALYDTYGKLIDLRLSNPELFTPSATFNWQVKESNWANGRFITSNSGNKAMVVAGNFTAGESTYTVSFPHTGKWFNAMDGTTINVISATQNITVPAHDFRLYVNFEP